MKYEITVIDRTCDLKNTRNSTKALLLTSKDARAFVLEILESLMIQSSPSPPFFFFLGPNQPALGRFWHRAIQEERKVGGDREESLSCFCLRFVLYFGQISLRFPPFPSNSKSIILKPLTFPTRCIETAISILSLS